MCTCSVSQHLDHLPNKQPRWHQVCMVATDDPGSSNIGNLLPSQPEGNAFMRGAEQGHRIHLALQPSSRGVAASSICGAQHLGHPPKGYGGSFCLIEDNPLPPLVLLNRTPALWGRMPSHTSGQRVCSWLTGSWMSSTMHIGQMVTPHHPE